MIDETAIPQPTAVIDGHLLAPNRPPFTLCTFPTKHP